MQLCCEIINNVLVLPIFIYSNLVLKLLVVWIWIWMIFVNLHGYHSNEVDVHYGHSDVSKAVNTEAADVMTLM